MYLTHKDNPDKYQYSDEDIQTLNGFSISDFVELSRSEVVEIKKKLMQLIINLDIYEYSDFMEYLFHNELNLEFDVASCNTYFFEKYISSRRNRDKHKRLVQCSDED